MILDYGYFVKETGESFYEKKPGITNNQAEYHGNNLCTEKIM